MLKLMERAIAQIDPPVSKPPLVQELELQPNVIGQHPPAAAKEKRDEEQVNLVDQPRPKGLRGEGWTAHGEVVR